MSSRQTADKEFELMLFTVGFVSTVKAGEYRCAVLARTATDAISQADDIISLTHKQNYAIMSVEPVLQMGITEVTD